MARDTIIPEPCYVTHDPARDRQLLYVKQGGRYLPAGYRWPESGQREEGVYIIHDAIAGIYRRIAPLPESAGRDFFVGHAKAMEAALKEFVAGRKTSWSTYDLAGVMLAAATDGGKEQLSTTAPTDTSYTPPTSGLWLRKDLLYKLLRARGQHGSPYEAIEVYTKWFSGRGGYSKVMANDLYWPMEGLLAIENKEYSHSMASVIFRDHDLKMLFARTVEHVAIWRQLEKASTAVVEALAKARTSEALVKTFPRDAVQGFLSLLTKESLELVAGGRLK